MPLNWEFVEDAEGAVRHVARLADGRGEIEIHVYNVQTRAVDGVPDVEGNPPLRSEFRFRPCYQVPSRNPDLAVRHNVIGETVNDRGHAQRIAEAWAEVQGYAGRVEDSTG